MTDDVSNDRQIIDFSGILPDCAKLKFFEKFLDFAPFEKLLK